MPFEIIRHNILDIEVDALVNPTNPDRYFGRSHSVSGQIEEAVGLSIMKDIYRDLHFLEYGDAKITEVPNLKAKYLVHVSTPIYKPENAVRNDTLAQCYRNACDRAEQKGCTSIAFPLLAAGNHQYPKDIALQVALSELQAYAMKSDMMIYLVVYERAAFNLTSKLYPDMKSYLKENFDPTLDFVNNVDYRIQSKNPQTKQFTSPSSKSIEESLRHHDKYFTDVLFEMIDARHLKDVDVYKRANLSKAVFSKIRTTRHYQPSKPTALALCVALRLNMEEASKLLYHAGFSFSNAYKMDIIVRYFIENNDYDIYRINFKLYEEDLPRLGSV